MSDLKDTDLMDRWLASGQTARICGFDLKPIAHPILKNTAWRIVKGQGSVHLLEAARHQKRWLLKEFTASRRPSDEYLQRAASCLPGRAEFFTCTQRRFLTARHLDLAYSTFKDPRLAECLEGTILMPKVPGQPWASLADQLREREIQLPMERRFKLAISLANCIRRLEGGGCSHRDLSSTNVFVTDKDEVYLIDLDSLYHPSLAYQPNTTIGTRGFIAPFTRSAGGDYDARLSWCNGADRFALAILITEFLQVSDQTPVPQEDGTLFAQSQLETPDHPALQPHMDALARLGRDLGALLWKALHAGSFDECPSPSAWQAVLRKSLHRSNPREARSSWIQYACSSCRTQFPIAEDRLESLQWKAKPILCRDCLRVQRQEWEAAEAQRDQQAPQVACEHCGNHIRRPRERIEQLRNNGKPILCGACLRQQITNWKTEQTRRESETEIVTCGRCSRSFRANRVKASDLRAKGKSLLCHECRHAIYIQQLFAPFALDKR